MTVNEITDNLRDLSREILVAEDIDDEARDKAIGHLNEVRAILKES